MLVLNGSKVETGLFPNNESWVEIGGLIEVKPYNSIEMKFENNDDIVNLIQLKGYLDSLHVETRLIVRYFPYSRMDFWRDDFHIYNDVQNGLGVSNENPATAALKLLLKMK